MTLYIFAGPNGSGKSTLIYEFKSKNPDVLFIDVDAMHKEYLARGTFRDIPDIKNQYIFTMKRAEAARNGYIDAGMTFGFETVFSTREKIDFLKRVKETGYEIIGVFVTTNNPAINKKRVEIRVKEGGHDVPPEKIESRYYKACENLRYLLEIADELYVYDNSGEAPVQVYFHDSDSYCLNFDITLNWINKYLAPYIDTTSRAEITLQI